MKVLKKLLIIIALAPIALIFFVLVMVLVHAFFVPPPSPETVLTRILGQALPDEINIRSNLYYFNPTLGDGRMSLVLNSTPDGVSNLLSIAEWSEVDKPRLKHMDENVDTHGLDTYEYRPSTSGWTMIQIMIMTNKNSILLDAEI